MWPDTYIICQSSVITPLCSLNMATYLFLCLTQGQGENRESFVLSANYRSYTIVTDVKMHCTHLGPLKQLKTRLYMHVMIYHDKEFSKRSLHGHLRAHCNAIVWASSSTGTVLGHLEESAFVFYPVTSDRLWGLSSRSTFTMTGCPLPRWSDQAGTVQCLQL